MRLLFHNLQYDTISDLNFIPAQLIFQSETVLDASRTQNLTAYGIVMEAELLSEHHFFWRYT